MQATMRVVAVSCLLALLCVVSATSSAVSTDLLDAASMEQSLEQAIEAQIDSELASEKSTDKSGVIPWVSGTKPDGTCTNGGLPGPDCVTSTYGLPEIDWPSSGSAKRRPATRRRTRRIAIGRRVQYRLRSHPLWLHQRERFYRPRRAIRGRCPRTIRLTFHKGRGTDNHIMVREYGRLVTPNLVFIHPRYAPRKYRVTLKRTYTKYVMRLRRKKRSVCDGRRASQTKKCKALKKKLRKEKKAMKKAKKAKKAAKKDKKRGKKAAKKGKKGKKGGKKGKEGSKKGAKKGKEGSKKTDKKGGKKGKKSEKKAKKGKKGSKKGKRGSKKGGKKDKKKRSRRQRDNENEEREPSLLSVDEATGLTVRTALHSGVRHVARHSYEGDARRFRNDPGMLVPVMADNTEEIIRNLPSGEAKFLYRLKNMIARNRGPEGPFAYHRPRPSFDPELPNANRVLLADRALEYLNQLPVVDHQKFVDALKTSKDSLEANDRLGDLMAKEWQSPVIYE